MPSLQPEESMNESEQTRAQYNAMYSRESFYWTVRPSAICFDVLRLLPPDRPLRLLDIGCGEGRNAVLFARNGYEVHAFDLSPAGIEKTRRLAAAAGVHVHAFQADLNEFRLGEPFDILFSTGTLHSSHPAIRRELFENYKEHTTEGGLNVVSVFVQKPFIARAPDSDPNAHPWRSGELFTHYHDWRIEWCTEEILDCMSSGIPHRHAVNRLIARKVTGSLEQRSGQEAA
jgi:tellurite methyltransferase